MKKKNSWFGIGLIVVGAILLLGSLSNLDLGGIILTWWPLILILGGLRMLTSRQRPQLVPSTVGVGDIVERTDGDRFERTTIAGDISLSTSSPAFGGGTVSTVVGDVTVDCRGATVAVGESTLRVSTVFGDGTVLLPPDAAVRVSGHTLFGDAEVFALKKGGISTSVTFETPGYESARARLRVDISQVFGDIEVRN
jgi:predicted membrane protein